MLLSSKLSPVGIFVDCDAPLLAIIQSCGCHGWYLPLKQQSRSQGVTQTAYHVRGTPLSCGNLGSELKGVSPKPVCNLRTGRSAPTPLIRSGADTPSMCKMQVCLWRRHHERVRRKLPGVKMLGHPQPFKQQQQQQWRTSASDSGPSQ